MQNPYMTLLSGLPETFLGFVITVSNPLVLLDITGTEMHLSGSTGIQNAETLYGCSFGTDNLITIIC